MVTEDLTLAPLGFGIVWTVTLVMFGVHLGRQASLVNKPPAIAPAVSSQTATMRYKDQK